MRRAVSTLVVLLVACSVMLASAALKVPSTDEKIILTTASGEQKIMTRAEMDAIESQQRQLHAQLLDRVEGEWVEDASLSDVARRDPELARSIMIARDSFAVLQRHGYARGYALSSFTEIDALPITSKRAQKDPDFNGNIELRITLQLRATLDATAGVEPNPGTSAAKRRAEPQALGYEVEVLFDKHEVASVVYAWQLTADDRRGKELRIAPSEALKKRYEERQRKGGASQYATWLLAGGVALVVVGGALLLLTPRAPPAKKAKAEEPPVTSPSKQSDGRRRQDAKTVLAREAGDKWELANGK